MSELRKLKRSVYRYTTGEKLVTKRVRGHGRREKKGGVANQHSLSARMMSAFKSLLRFGGDR